MLRIQPPLAFSNGVFLENRIFYISFSTTLFMLLFDKPYSGSFDTQLITKIERSEENLTGRWKIWGF
jgi:hypothetical protein